MYCCTCRWCGSGAFVGDKFSFSDRARVQVCVLTPLSVFGSTLLVVYFESVRWKANGVRLACAFATGKG